MPRHSVRRGIPSLTERIRPVAGLALALGALAASSANAHSVKVGQLFAPDASCSADTTFLQTGVSSGKPYVVPSSGLITSWSFQDGASTVSYLKLKVGRPAGGGKYTIVGQSVAGAQTANAVNTYPAKIKVQKGDIVGIYEYGGTCRSTAGMTSADIDSFFQDDVLPGSTRTYAASAPARIPVSATLLLPPKTVFTGVNFRPHGATFRFSASGASFFQCRLITPQQHPRFLRCSSPQSFSHLPAGSYEFQVRGVNAAGPDPQPATATFTT